MDEVLVDEQLEARAYWAYPEDLGEGVKMPGVPFVLPSSPTQFKAAPTLGADTASVLDEVGLQRDEIESLATSGVIGLSGAERG